MKALFGKEAALSGEVERRTAQEALHRLLAAYETWYDVAEGHVLAGRAFAGYAELHSECSQYVLTKRAKLWEAHAHERVFFHAAERVAPSEMLELIDLIKTHAIEGIQPEPNHMSTGVTLVVLAETVDEHVWPMVRKARFRKNFLFGLRGWADLRVAVVDLGAGVVDTNAAGEDLKSVLDNHFCRIL